MKTSIIIKGKPSLTEKLNPNSLYEFILQSKLEMYNQYIDNIFVLKVTYLPQHTNEDSAAFILNNLKWVFITLSNFI